MAGSICINSACVIPNMHADINIAVFFPYFLNKLIAYPLNNNSSNIGATTQA